MSMSVSLHAKDRGELEIDFGIREHDGRIYPVLNLDLNTSDGFETVSIFPSFEKLLEMQQKLNQLIEESKERGFLKEGETENEQNHQRTMSRSIPDSDF